VDASCLWGLGADHVTPQDATHHSNERIIARNPRLLIRDDWVGFTRCIGQDATHSSSKRLIVRTSHLLDARDKVGLW
jgi:hypothetical protein